MHTGSCVCKGIRYQISGELSAIQVCHCVECRKAQGSAFATNIPVSRQHFKLLAGADLLKAFNSPTRAGKSRCFCSQCGSPIYSQMESDPDVLRIRVGTIDEPVGSQLAMHQFVSEKASWWEIDDDLPQHLRFRP